MKCRLLESKTLYNVSEVVEMLVNENELDDPDKVLMEGSDDDFSDLEWQEKIIHLHNTHIFFKPPTRLSHTHTHTHTHTHNC